MERHVSYTKDGAEGGEIGELSRSDLFHKLAVAAGTIGVGEQTFSGIDLVRLFVDTRRNPTLGSRRSLGFKADQPAHAADREQRFLLRPVLNSFWLGRLCHQ